MSNQCLHSIIFSSCIFKHLPIHNALSNKIQIQIQYNVPVKPMSSYYHILQPFSAFANTQCRTKYQANGCGPRWREAKFANLVSKIQIQLQNKEICVTRSKKYFLKNLFKIPIHTGGGSLNLHTGFQDTMPNTRYNTNTNTNTGYTIRWQISAKYQANGCGPRWR